MTHNVQNDKVKQKAGYTITELLVFLAILAMLIPLTVSHYTKAGYYETNLRAMAAARTSLSLTLERLERGLSLSSETIHINESCNIIYPQIHGGISMETNRVTNLQNAVVTWNKKHVEAVISYRDGYDETDHKTTKRQLNFYTYSAGTGLPEYDITGLVITNIPEHSQIMRMTLSAEVPLKNSSGQICLKPVTVTRYAGRYN